MRQSQIHNCWIYIFLIFPPKDKSRKQIDSYKTYSALADADLVDAYKQTSDQQPLAVLYQRYTDLVFGVCLKYLKTADLAKDASLDIYEELVTKVKKHEIDNFRGWLAVLVRNHCLMKLRNPKNKATVDLPEDFMQLGEDVHLNGVMDKENKLQAMEKCIETLNQEQQTMVRLFYLQEKCYNEIAEQTGLSWNLVRSHIQNGRRNLKLCMEANNG